MNAKDYLQQLIPESMAMRFPEEESLVRVRALLAELGNPHGQFDSIHVAGTSGKGSICTMASYMLQEAGYKTGLIISPTINSYKERMYVDNKEISDEMFDTYAARIQKAVTKVNNKGLGEISYYEAIVVLAFYVFAQEGVDVAIVETGLGGTYDATNVLDSVVSVIGPIGYDHTHVLGPRLEDIAAHKAGVIKKSNKGVVVSEQDPEAMDVVEHKAKSVGAEIYLYGQKYSAKDIQVSREGTSFRYVSHDHDIKLHTALIGHHQAENAAAAVTAVQLYTPQIAQKAIQSGLEQVVFPGRFEIIQKDGATFVLDGAHNEQKIQAIVATMQDVFPNEKVVCIFAAKKKKNVDAMLGTLDKVVDLYIFTEFQIKKMKNAAVLKVEELPQQGRRAVLEKDQSRALQKAKDLAGKTEGKPILIIGSLHLVSQLRRLLV